MYSVRIRLKQVAGRHPLCRVRLSTYVLIFNGVWLSLVRARVLGTRGRRFESCHPNFGISLKFISDEL